MLAIVATLEMTLSGCGGTTTTATTTIPVTTTSTTSATTTSTPSTTTTSTMSTTSTTPTTTTTSVTTTTEVTPPTNGFYIVEPSEYPGGIAFSVGDFGNSPSSELGGVGFYLPEGSKIYAPFDGYLDTSGYATIGGQVVHGGYMFDDATGNLVFEVDGNGIAMADDGPKRRGDVVGVVTNPNAILTGLDGRVNTLIVLAINDDTIGPFESREELILEYFPYAK
jgi:hypothetical protein